MWRGVSLRLLAMLVLGPLLTETLVTLFITWMVLYAERSLQIEPWHHMLIPMSGSLAYAGSAFIAGRWVTPRWAPRLMTGSILVTALLGLAAMYFRSYPIFIACTFTLNLAIGHYYTPFQINMTHVRPFRTLAWSIAFYNVAWGTGASLGPLFGGSLQDAAVSTLVGIAVLIAILHTILSVSAALAPHARDEVEHTVTFHSTHRQRLTTLIAFLAVNAMIRGLYITYWPHLGVERGWSNTQIGLGQFCLYVLIPVGSLLWAPIRTLFVGPGLMLLSMIVGAAGFALLNVSHRWEFAIACVLAIGVMESCAVFCTIYYVNSDPDPRSRARWVGLFEMCAGLAGISGPATYGLLTYLAERWHSEWLPTAVPAAVVIGAILFVLVSRPGRGHFDRYKLFSRSPTPGPDLIPPPPV